MSESQKNKLRAFWAVILLVSIASGCQDAGDGGPDPSKEEVAEDSAGGTPEDRRKARRARMEALQSRPVPVAVASVQRGRVDAYYSSTTTLTADEEAVVVARTEGVVEHIYVEEGDAVEEEQPLAQLDTERLELEVARTRANLNSLQRAFDRAKQLAETSMISPDAYDRARFDLEREQANLALQLHQLEEATIRAPISGVITVRHIKLGNTLSPSTPAFEIKRADLVEAVLNVPEKEMSKLEKGQLAVVRVDAIDAREFEGVIDRVAPEVDAESGTFRVTVVLDNPGVLKPGMFARVNIRYDTNEDTLLVSREAVIRDKDQSSVFVVRDGLAMRQPVVVGYTMGSEVEILEGLGEGDEVVVTGQGGLRDGAPVRVVPL